MDQWMPAHRRADGRNAPYVMGYHTRADIPFQFALAEAFTICDAYHCSVMASTWPNRMYWMTGTIDPDGQNGGPIIDTGSRVAPGGLTWTTYAERLEQAGVSWKVYHQKDDEGGFNMLDHFKAFREAAPDSALYKKGVYRGAAEDFEQDAQNDRLPTVSWIMTTGSGSEHPNGMPAAGAALIASKIDAIAANPEVWAKTAFILNYDENDGLFDHIVPPSPPPGEPGEYANGVNIGAGFRVPCIIVSPWTAGGWVCSQPFDHTSTLQFVERITGVREPNITPWRRKTFGDLTSAFRFEEAATPPPVLPGTSGLLSAAKFQAATLPSPAFPNADQQPPLQEKGKKKRIPMA
jgi:phospholipase C